MSISFDGRPAIVGGADLGRQHALELAVRGTKVVVSAGTFARAHTTAAAR